MSMKIPLIMHKLGIVNLPVTFNFADTMVAMRSKIFEHSDLHNPESRCASCHQVEEDMQSARAENFFLGMRVLPVLVSLTTEIPRRS